MRQLHILMGRTRGLGRHDDLGLLALEDTDQVIDLFETVLKHVHSVLHLVVQYPIVLGILLL